MKTILLMLTICSVLALPAFAQKVEVSQQFVDDANTAFVEVVALRKVVEAQQNEIQARIKLDESRMLLIDAKDKQIEAQNEMVRKLTAIKCNETRWLFGIVKTKRCF
jgi:hypothetical protein